MCRSFRGFSQGIRIAGLGRDLGQYEPATEVAFGLAQDCERRRDGDRNGVRARQRNEELEAERDPVGFFDHRGDREKVRAVRFSSCNARCLGGECEMRLPARRDFREDRSERSVVDRACRAERCCSARVVAGERALRDLGRTRIARIGERAHASAVELATERATSRQPGLA